VQARGVDLNREMVEVSQARGLDVVERDALGYLRGLSDGSLDWFWDACEKEGLPVGLLAGGNMAALDRIAPRVNGHLLESYVAYWQLRLKIDDAAPEAIRSFLDRYAGTPLADTLRGEWLKSLGKRALWTEFAAEYPKRNGEDTELACFALQWRRESDRERALADARQYWFSGRDQPESCQPLFAELEAQGQITPADIWSRFRLAHEAGNLRLAARLVGELPANERPSAADYDRAERNPGPALAKGDFRFAARSGRELALPAGCRATAAGRACCPATTDRPGRSRSRCQRAVGGGTGVGAPCRVPRLLA